MVQDYLNPICEEALRGRCPREAQEQSSDFDQEPEEEPCHRVTAHSKQSLIVSPTTRFKVIPDGVHMRFKRKNLFFTSVYGDCEYIAASTNPHINWVHLFSFSILQRFDETIKRQPSETIYPSIILFLAFLTFGLIPLNIVTNYVFSYRIDPAKFFNTYSNYNYQKTYSGFILFSFWTHKIGTIIWTCSVITHILVITIFGIGKWKHSRRFHATTGITVVLSSLISAIFGIIVMTQHDARYNTFTQFFLYFPTVLVAIAAPGIILLRSLDALVAYRDLHVFFGFILLLPPLAMMIQFLLFSTLLGMKIFDDEFFCWKVAMIMSSIVGIISACSFIYHSYYIGRARLGLRVKKNAGYKPNEKWWKLNDTESFEGCDSPRQPINDADWLYDPKARDSTETMYGYYYWKKSTNVPWVRVPLASPDRGVSAYARIRML